MPTDTTQRVHIIGGGGSGKTTLARRIASAHDVPHIELDLGAYKSPMGAIDGRAGWVTEGIFLYGIEPILEAAAVIVWLDLPWRVARRRILWRHLRLSVARRNPHRGLRRLWQFLSSQRTYYTAEATEPSGPTDWSAITRQGTQIILALYTAKTVRLRRSRDVARWAAEFGA